MAATQPQTSDFILTTTGMTVSINFVQNTVTMGNSTRPWPLSQVTKVIGSNNFVRVKRTPDMKVKVLNGPAGFITPEPNPEPGTRYVYLEGMKNKWKVIKETPRP